MAKVKAEIYMDTDTKEVFVQADGNFFSLGQGVVLQSADESKFNIIADNDGKIGTVEQ